MLYYIYNTCISYILNLNLEQYAIYTKSFSYVKQLYYYGKYIFYKFFGQRLIDNTANRLDVHNNIMNRINLGYYIKTQYKNQTLIWFPHYILQFPSQSLLTYEWIVMPKNTRNTYFTLVSTHSNIRWMEILYKLAGPTFDFGGTIPSLNLLNALCEKLGYDKIEEDKIILETDMYEEIVLY